MIREESESDRGSLEQLMNIDKAVGATCGCIAFALYGNCYRGKEYKHFQGHNEAVARETRKWMQKKLSQMSADESTGPRKILPWPGGPS